MAFFKNTAGQYILVYAHDAATDTPKTGDAANITAQISKDGGAPAATDDTNPTEIDATDVPGIYRFTMTTEETNAELLVVSAVSSTADVKIEPVIMYPTQSTPAAIVDAILDELLAGHTTADSLGAAIRDLRDRFFGKHEQNQVTGVHTFYRGDGVTTLVTREMTTFIAGDGNPATRWDEP